MRNTGIFFFILALLDLSSCASRAPSVAPKPPSAIYSQVNLVSNNPEFHAQMLEPALQNAWGIAIRPAGKGGHFWVTAQATGTSIQYVGDVDGHPLYQDPLKIVRLKEGRKNSTPTGVVFNPADRFVIKQPSPQGAFASESKFLFATDSGCIYAWAEKKNPDGGMNRPEDAVLKIDHRKRGDRYFGLALDSKGEKLFVADFGRKPRIHVFGPDFREQNIGDGFKNPFIQHTFPGAQEYAPYNVQVFNIDGRDRVLVAYTQTKKDHKSRNGRRVIGEERKGEGLGRVVEYDLEGRMVRIWNDKGLLNAPWGFAWAPAQGFGRYAGDLLVGNFGNGSIVAFDPKTFEAIDMLRDSYGEPITIEGLWGLVFGNGASLGESNHLYFAAGPGAETDGLFGKIVPADEKGSQP